ncbi:MAG: PTS sugar transporter subunit IIC, partial [Mycoplasma sp.]|nr:PTS sugar transporter subunit IIC [Mycoplasma sp.]
MVYLQVATINSISIYVVAALGYYLAKNKSMDSPYLASVLALTAYLISINLMTSVNWEHSLYWLGARGMLGGIIIAIIAVELYAVLTKNNRLAITMPDGVPPAVGRAFAKLFPIIFSLLFVAAINLIVWLPTYGFYGKEPLWVAKEGASLKIGLTKNFEFKKENTKLFFDIFGKNKEHFDFTKGSFESLKNWLNGKESTFDPTKVSSAEIELLKNMIVRENVSIFDPNGDMLGAFIKNTDKDSISNVLSDKALSGGMTFVAFIYVIAIAPFLLLISTEPGALLGIAMLYVFIASLFWFAGLHGINIANGIFNPIWLLLYAQNISGQKHIFVQGTFDAFIFIGGSGASLALLIATLIFGTRKTQHHEISKLSTGAGIFQINEPVIYGYPIMLNPVMFIPFVLVMPILCVTTFVGYKIFGDSINHVNVIVPWTVPFIAATFLATSG